MSREDENSQYFSKVSHFVVSIFYVIKIWENVAVFGQIFTLSCFPGEEDKLIIFVGRKITADDISSNIAMREDIPVTVNCIHGDREQSDREQVMMGNSERSIVVNWTPTRIGARLTYTIFPC